MEQTRLNSENFFFLLIAQPNRPASLPAATHSRPQSFRSFGHVVVKQQQLRYVCKSAKPRTSSNDISVADIKAKATSLRAHVGRELAKTRTTNYGQGLSDSYSSSRIF